MAQRSDWRGADLAVIAVVEADDSHILRNAFFSNQYEQPGQIDYHEYAFDIPRKKIAGYSLYGDFVTFGMKTEVNRRVTFPLANDQ